jgi:glycosyltransferase involved in cell wall biosynthesis
MRNLYEPQVPRPYNNKPLTSHARRAWHWLFYGVAVRRWDREATLRARSVIANSRYTAAYARRAYGISAQFNYPGVDPDVFRPGDGDRERFVLSVGEVLPTKGFDWAVRAIAALPKPRPPLVVVSNRVYEPERRYLAEVARVHGVDLLIRERVPDAELRRLYQTASVLLYTPHREPFGLAAIEAMASATPVVAVREAGPAETVLDGTTGFLCERDPAVLAEAVSKVIDDEALRRRMGNAGRDHVLRHFTWDQSVEQLQGMLLNAAESMRTSKDDSRASDPLERTDVAVARRET